MHSAFTKFTDFSLSPLAEERRLAAVSVFQAQTEAPSLPEPQQDRHQHADGRGESPCGQQAQRTQGELRRRAGTPQDDVVAHDLIFLPQMGGAMAPPMKELPRWLLDNPEFSVAPDWTEIVKQSVSDIRTFLRWWVSPPDRLRLANPSPFRRVSCLKPCSIGC